MKVINLLLYVVLLLSSLTQVKAQTNTKSLDTLSYMLSEGDVLLFDVIDNSNKYELKVTFTSVSEGKLDFEKILFDWTKTGENINKSGSVKYCDDVVASLDIYNLNLTNSFRIDFENLINRKIFYSHGIWLGPQALAILGLSGGDFGMEMLGDTIETQFSSLGKSHYTECIWNGNKCLIPMEKYTVRDKENSYMMVQEGNENTLILSANLPYRNFSMKLKSITTEIEEKPRKKTFIIGDQEWMTSNLDVKNYRNGDPILQSVSLDHWLYAYQNKIPTWCYPNFDARLGKKLGILYNWYAVADERGIAPEGYHVPTKEEYKKLAKSLDNDRKTSTAFGDSLGLNIIAGYVNESTTQGVTINYRQEDIVLAFRYFIPRTSYVEQEWWSSTDNKYEASTFQMHNLIIANRDCYFYDILEELKHNGLPVRCVKDTPKENR